MFINRELSWLAFNERVLAEARDASTPLLERLKFLAITGSNLDEFFMVRVGGLQQLADEGRGKTDSAGLTPLEQLKDIGLRVRRLTAAQYACLIEELETALAAAGILRIRPNALPRKLERHLERFFDQDVYPVVTPIAADFEKEFPRLPGLRVNLLVRLKPLPGKRGVRHAVVTLPKSLARFITLPVEKGFQYVLLEDVAARYAAKLFSGESILETAPFRITRNADMSVREDKAADLLAEMKAILVERKHSIGIRLEIEETASAAARDFLRKALRIPEDRIYPVPGPLDLSAYFRIAGMAGFNDLKNEEWPPQPVPGLGPADSIFDVVGRRDVLLFHPYDSFEPVLRMIETAADDPDVLAIKQILYRTSDNSPVVAALVRAAEKEKHVTALVELKARFDEALNIEGAQALERAGAQVIYGIRGLKTHAKLCIIVRRESSGIRRYVHFGTGNYNEKTARLYTDVGFLTSHEDYAADASAFFNTITGYSQPVPYRKIEAAPIALKSRLIELIEAEAERSKQGQKCLIRARVNSLADRDVIQALYKASQCGVPIRLNVRGICCLRPGVKGLSETIEVVSIVDRFLEHSRIVHFHNGGEDLVFISSADWMTRNLDKRIELLVPVEDGAGRSRLLSILDVAFQDNVKAWKLQADGSYARLENPGKKKAVRSQAVFFEKAAEAAREVAKKGAREFVPHRPPETF